MKSRYTLVAQRALHHCEYCKAPEAIFNFPFEVEHITPPRRGGTNGDENLALACRSCNLFKSDFLVYQDPVSLETARLFHPRVDRWQDHFACNFELGSIDALAPIGRALDTDWKSNSCMLANEFRSSALGKASMGSTRALSLKW